MELALPAVIDEFLSSLPEVGDECAIVPLITSDEDGTPRACMLSAGQLALVDGCLRMFVGSESVSRNLPRTRRALILITIGDTVYHCVLAFLDSRRVLGETVYACQPVSLRVDTVGVPLRPMAFRASEELVRLERWSEIAEILRDPELFGAHG